MDDSHPSPTTFRGDASARRRAHVTVQRPSRLGQTLREARRDSDLELEDISETTRIRLSHLEALEAGRFNDLPGDPHGKNYVRRYAQAVGLDPARALILYTQERRLAAHTEPAGLELPPERSAALPNYLQFGRSARLIASLLLVGAAIWLALRAFDGMLTSAPAQTEQAQTQSQVTEPSRAVPDAAAATTPASTQATTPAMTPAMTPTAPAMILLSLRTTPPGAEISIDGYRVGQSPLVDAPVRAGNRTLKVERGGYGTFERTLDLSQDRSLNVTLLPKGAGQPTMTGTAAVSTPAPQTANPVTTAQVVVTVSAEAWLEVYRGTARGEGERLVYETAQPGTTYSFTAPVYIFSGNAGGVSVTKGDAKAQPLGTSGAVVGAVY